MSEITQSNDSNRKIRSRKVSTRIDMTPMVDLAFLLLTFFVMTTSLMKGYVLPIEMPDKPDIKSRQPTVPEKDALTLILGKDDKVYWYMGLTDPELKKTDFSKDGIRKVLMEKKTQLPKLVVIIKASDESRFQNIIDVFDEMDICNIERYAMVDITTIDSQLVSELK